MTNQERPRQYIEDREFPDGAIRVINAGMAIAHALSQVRGHLNISGRIHNALDNVAMAIGNEEPRSR